MKSSYDIISPSSNRNQDLPPIILLHAILDTRKSWKKVGPALAKRTGRKVYALDARNHGDSPRSEEMNYDVLTEDLKEFMDDKHIQKAVIVGHSMGGRTAITFALKYPNRTDALVVEDMTAKNVDSGYSKLVPQTLDLIQSFVENLPPEYDLDTGLRSLLETVAFFGDNKIIDPKTLLENVDSDMLAIRKNGRKFELSSSIKAAKSLLQSNALVQDLPNSNLKFEGKTLFLYGSRPFFNLANDESIRKLFPKAVVKKIEGAFHYIHIDSLEAFVDIVTDFILHRNVEISKY